MSDVAVAAKDRFAVAEQRYLSTTPGSLALYERARKVLPDGLGRSSIPFFHYPIFVDRAEGKFLYDVDGRPILDLWNAASSLPLGHAPPSVIEAVQAQVARGLGFGAMNPLEVELAEILAEQIPTMQRVRFTASGTEATMFAVRLARAFTGRRLFARMEGSYHGLHDMMCSGQGMSLGGTWLGLNDDPVSNGVLPEVREGVVFLPFNDLAACEEIIEAQASELAALIVEPFLGTGGGIPAEREFLAGLRRLCDRHGIVLIFDEMISIGMARGGAQAFYGVAADLTATGKLIGGGMPLGVFGGRADIMKLLDAVGGVPPMMHTGTWNGHPLVMAAGVAQMKALTPEVYAYLGHIGDYMRERARALAERKNVAVQVLGVQHFSAFHYTDQPIRTHADTKTADGALSRRVAFSLLSQGFYLFGGRSNLSAAVDEADIDRFIAALEIAFDEAGVTDTR